MLARLVISVRLYPDSERSELHCYAVIVFFSTMTF